MIQYRVRDDEGNLEESVQWLQECVILSPEAAGLVLTRLNSSYHQDSA